MKKRTRPKIPPKEAKLDLRRIASRAREMYQEQVDDPDWGALEEWMKLSWFLEAAADLGMDL